MRLIQVVVTAICFVHIYSGQGGYITLINETDSDWKLVEQKSNKMNSWNFPSLIKAKTASHVYVEWSQEIFHISANDNGAAVYRLVGADHRSFSIQARSGPFRIEVIVQNISIDGKPENAGYDLGWEHNGDVLFVLVQNNGRYSGTGMNTLDWIKTNIEYLGNRTLKEVCLPGTHDSGMSMFDRGSTLFGHPCNTLTQSNTIKDQLQLGVRYFDIRPVIKEGQFVTGHYERIPWSWQGACGQSIKSIIEDVNDFTNGRSEVVIISLSHSLNTDFNSSREYRRFSHSDWHSLFALLDMVNYRYGNEDFDVELSQLTINDLTNNGRASAVLFIVRESGVDLADKYGKGYFNPNNANLYDVYTNTNNFMEMKKDQINKMKVYSKDHYFLLSWTLTQNIEEAAFCPMSGVKSIKNLAEEANKHLINAVYSEVSASSFPNIICVDDIKNPDITAIALAINKKLLLP